MSFLRASFLVWILTFIIVGVSIEEIIADDSPECDNYRFKEYRSSGDALSDRQAGMIKIQGPRAEGTGFLVDSEDGLIITASHILKSSTQLVTPHVVIHGVPAANPQKTIRMIVVAELPHDLTVLRLLPPQTGDASPKDFAFFELAPGRIHESVEFGYAGYRGKDLSPLVSPRGSMLNKIYDKKYGVTFQILSNVLEGFSGGPVVDSRGLVYGILLQNRGTETGIVRPTFRVATALSDLPELIGTRKLLAAFDALEQNTDVDIFKKIFDPSLSNSNRISNMAFLQFLRRLSLKYKNKEEVPMSVRKYIVCPIFWSAQDRGLDTGLMWIAKLLPDSTDILQRAAFKVNSGDSEYAQGNIENARRNWSEAQVFSAGALVHYLNDNLTSTAVLFSGIGIPPKPSSNDHYNITGYENRLKAQLDRLELPIESVPRLWMDWAAEVAGPYDYRGPIDNRLGSLLNDHAGIRWRLAQLGSKQRDHREISEEAALAAVVSTAETRAQSAELVGDIARADNKFEDATRAYATAWQEGNKSNIIATKFDSARDRLSVSSLSYGTSIETAPGLDRQPVYYAGPSLYNPMRSFGSTPVYPGPIEKDASASGAMASDEERSESMATPGERSYSYDAPSRPAKPVDSAPPSSAH